MIPQSTAPPPTAMCAFSTPLSEPTSFLCRPVVRRIVYTGLSLFLALTVMWPLLAQFKAQIQDPEFLQHIAAHRVMVGMTKQQVLDSWGGPQTINTTFTKEGLRHEEWIFEDWENASALKHRYLYFEEGSLIGGWFQGSGERLPMMTPTNPHAPQRPGEPISK